MKKIIPAICIGFLLCFFVSVYMDSTEAALSEGLIRLHVIANSDSEADQQLKLKVRDRILKECASLANDSQIEAVRADICTNLDYIEEIARDEIKKNGYDYAVKASYGMADFPEKRYGSITLPSGSYQALRVEIGKAEGKNWWCVLFPPLCFVDETCVSVSEESNDILRSQLGDSTYDMVTTDSAAVEFRLKSYEIWQMSKMKLRKYMADIGESL